MPHQDTVLLIYVFSIFGLVLLLMFSSFYACHLYAQRLERLNPPNTAPPAQVCNSVQWTADCSPVSTAALHANPGNKCTLAQIQVARRTSVAIFQRDHTVQCPTFDVGHCTEYVCVRFHSGLGPRIDLLLRALQDAESQLVPMKQAFFIEQPDG